MTEERSSERERNTCTRNLYSSGPKEGGGGAGCYSQSVSIRTYEYRERGEDRNGRERNKKQTGEGDNIRKEKNAL